MQGFYRVFRWGSALVDLVQYPGPPEYDVGALVNRIGLWVYSTIFIIRKPRNPIESIRDPQLKPLSQAFKTATLFGYR